MKYLVPFVFATVTLALAIPAGAEVVFENSFESPAVTLRTPRSAGGDISKEAVSQHGEKPAWRRFEDQPNIGAVGGSVVAGLTNEVARTGKQSLFIEATKLSAPYIGALFVTRPIPIEGGRYYTIALWARNDAKKPLVCAAAQLFLKMQVDFFTDEGRTETGDSQYMLQPLPGGKGHPPSILPVAWTPVGLNISAPPLAKFMVVTFRCDSSAEKGAITGGIFFDDFSVETRPPPVLKHPLE